MKKKLLYIPGLCLISLLSCKKDEIETYHGSNYIQFASAWQDSTTVAFVFHPDATELKVPLVSVMSALPDGKDMAYAIEVDKTQTTALEGTHYALPERTAFQPGKFVDTAYISFFRTPDMLSQSYRLVVKMLPNDQFLLGELAYQYKVFRVHDMIAQPAWWNTDIINNYLGAYSDKKYRLVIQETGISDLTNATVSVKRDCAVRFKYWLLREKQAGHPVWDDANNQEMTVPVKG